MKVYTLQELEAVLNGLEESAVILEGISVERLCGILGGVGGRLLDPDDALHREALARLPDESGLTPRMSSDVILHMAAGWTEESLLALVKSQFSPVTMLDGFVEVEGARGGRVRALGDVLAFHLASGTVPGVGATSLLRSLLVKTPVLLKPGAGDQVLSRVVARGVAQADARLAQVAQVVYWPGGTGELETLVLNRARRVVVYGGDETVEAVRARLPAGIPMVAYAHRLSVGLVGRDRLGGLEQARRLAAQAARSVWWYDQRGCVSPHVVWVEERGRVSPEDWLRLLAREMDVLPRPTTHGDPQQSARIQQERGIAEMRAAGGAAGGFLGDPELRWTLLWETDAALQASPLGCTLRVKGVADLGEVPGLLAPHGRHLQSAALEVGSPRREGLAMELGRAGVTRVTTFEDQAWPPAWWHHDGGDALRSLVRFITLDDDAQG
ncbi:MAG: acyl-CoA reductase [Gemmatimonadota bacterium]